MIDQFLTSGAIVSLPDKKIAVGVGKHSWQKKSQGDFSFYFPDFFLENEKPWLIFESTKIFTLDEFSNLLTHPIVAEQLSWISPNKNHFSLEIDNLKQMFAEKKLEKGVPYCFEKSYSKFPKEMLCKSIHSAIEYAKKYSLSIYGFWNQDIGFLGATPELLFSLHGKSLQTTAIASTFTNSNDLPTSSKLIDEHSLVIKGIKDCINGLGDIKIQEPFALQLPGFCHIAAPIEINLKTDICFNDAVNIFHPTPAVGTYPKKEGEMWLKHQQNKYPRYRFAAPVGYMDGKTGVSTCYVALRNIQWFKDLILLGVGCGVIIDSVVDDEWNEIQLKIKATKEVLGLCS